MSYNVGDKVRAKATVVQGPNEDMPAQHFCDKGDILVVRAVRADLSYPISVSHEHITDRSFGVSAEEIEPLSVPGVGGPFGFVQTEKERQYDRWLKQRHE
jgi:hypothetical protein